MKTINKNLETALESHLRAIENAVQIANLDGGCDCANDVLYHVNVVREIVNPEQEIQSNVEVTSEFNQKIPESKL